MSVGAMRRNPKLVGHSKKKTRRPISVAFKQF
uniref:Uncharacterized protein n=1 Tax=Rhizophora mucronata TaxID=61149 RepID=A0A2P2Q0V2_RHIMU